MSAPITVSLSSTVVVARDVLSSELGSEYVMLNLEDGTYYGLDSVGGVIWQMLRTPVRVTAICAAIEETHDVDAERVERDVLKLLADLAGRRLIEVREDGIAHGAEL
jgi:hypothetical protein